MQLVERRSVYCRDSKFSFGCLFWAKWKQILHVTDETKIIAKDTNISIENEPNPPLLR